METIIKSVTQRQNIALSWDEALEWHWSQTWEIVIGSKKLFVSSELLHKYRESLRNGTFDISTLDEYPDHDHGDNGMAGYAV